MTNETIIKIKYNMTNSEGEKIRTFLRKERRRTKIVISFHLEKYITYQINNLSMQTYMLSFLLLIFYHKHKNTKADGIK